MSLHHCYSCGHEFIEWDELPGRYEDPAMYVYACARCGLESTKQPTLTKAREAWQRANLNWGTVKFFTGVSSDLE